MGDSNISQFHAEFKVWRSLWLNDKGEHPITALGTLNKCPSAAFPRVHKLIQILALLPVSTAEAERCFSKVTRTLTALRATMCEERLEALIMFQTHRNILPSTNEVLNYFSKSGKRRLGFELPL